MASNLFHQVARSVWGAPILVAAFTILLAGCGAEPNPDGRENVSGTITLNGTALSGSAGIVFAAVDGGEGGGRAQIKQGSYLLTGYDGVMPGKYIVRIFATVDFDKTTGNIADNTVLFGNEISVDVVPPEFNKESKLEFEVVAGGRNVFNYDIQTDYRPEIPKGAKGKAGVPL